MAAKGRVVGCWRTVAVGAGRVGGKVDVGGKSVAVGAGWVGVGVAVGRGVGVNCTSVGGAVNCVRLIGASVGIANGAVVGKAARVGGGRVTEAGVALGALVG